MSRLTRNANQKASRSQPHPFEGVRAKVIKEIVDFMRDNDNTAVLELKLPSSDAEAISQGWPSAETQQAAVHEIVENLPVDVAARVKLVKKSRGRARSDAFASGKK